MGHPLELININIVPCLLLIFFLNERKKIFLINVLCSPSSLPSGNHGGEFGVLLVTKHRLVKMIYFFYRNHPFNR